MVKASPPSDGKLGPTVTEVRYHWPRLSLTGALVTIVDSVFPDDRLTEFSILKGEGGASCG